MAETVMGKSAESADYFPFDALDEAIFTLKEDTDEAFYDELYNGLR